MREPRPSDGFFVLIPFPSEDNARAFLDSTHLHGAVTPADSYLNEKAVQHLIWAQPSERSA